MNNGGNSKAIPSRYCVGIDLGTTNSVVAYVDTLTAEDGVGASRLFSIEQRVGDGLEQASDHLPSALLYEPHIEGSWAVGRYAAEQARYQPQRVVLSAKSWLSHAGVNREGKILPWGSTEVPTSAHLSPVEASSRVLSTIRDVWNKQMAAGEPDYRLEEQEVVITVPASFDEVAQELTLRAAYAVGFKRVRLLEEPQSAFYRWLELSGQQLKLNRLVLVCDIGGGTTDLSLFEVSQGEGVLPRIARIDVSDHILLGGDNIDATLAEQLGELLKAKQIGELAFSQRLALRAIARAVKEQVHSDKLKALSTMSISVPAAGASLFANSLSLELSTSKLRELVMEGFFPLCSADERPQSTRGGLREVGLPYARDPRITVHLAAFLRGRSIGAVLFNGGTLRDVEIRDRILRCLQGWQSDPIEELSNNDFDSAVARGAAWYASMLRQQDRRLIFAGYPRSLYVELYRERRADEPKLLCVVPKGYSGVEPLIIAADGLSALVEKPVRFQIWSSLTRSDDPAGAIIDESTGGVRPFTSAVTQLSVPSKHTLPSGARLPISLVSKLSETGLLALECRGVVPLADGDSRDVSWKLTFNVRKDEEREFLDRQDAQLASGIVQRCIEVIDRYYGRRKGAEGGERPKGLFRALEDTARMSREEWSIEFMRALWPACERGITRRGRSLEHEVQWLHLAGFILRPGFGAALDSVRVQEAWRLQELGLAFPKETAARAAACIFWRRIAAGLSSTQQELLFQCYLPELSKSSSYGSELVRMLATLERIEQSSKERLFRTLSEIFISPKKNHFGDALGWALERLLARLPLCGELDTVVPGATAGAWAQTLVAARCEHLDARRMSAILLSVAAQTGDARRDIDADLKKMLIKKLRSLGTSTAAIESLQHTVEMEPKQIARLLGDNVPAGLLIL